MLESCEKLNNQALVFAHKGDFEEAIACLKRAVLIEKDNYLLWLNLGLIYRDACQFEAAKNALSYSLKIKPDDQDTLETIASVCISLEEFDEAIQYCSEGLDANQYNPHLWNNMGVACFNQEDYEHAAEYFETAVFIDSFYYDALYNLKDTYQELGNAAGVEECTRMMKSIPKGK